MTVLFYHSYPASSARYKRKDYSMTWQEIARARDEALRFLQAVSELSGRLKEELGHSEDDDGLAKAMAVSANRITRCKQYSAVKSQSMVLSRSLIDMRSKKK